MSLERNTRVAARWDELTAIGKHGHYETLIQVVREEVDRAASVVARARDVAFAQGLAAGALIATVVAAFLFNLIH